MQQGGCGGVIRDDKRDFIAGFFFQINNCFRLLAEIRAMLHGLKLAWDEGLRQVVIESDSLEVVNMVQNHVGNLDQVSACIGDILKIQEQDQSTQIRHIHKEANKAADMLAKMVFEAAPGFCDVEYPSDLLNDVLVV